MSDEAVAPIEIKPNGYPVETYINRDISRQIDRHLHVPGLNAANFRADVEAMLKDGLAHGLTDREFRFLHHALKCCIRPADNAEGAVVSLSGRQFGRFIGIRRTFLSARLQSTATNTTENDQ